MISGVIWRAAGGNIVKFRAATRQCCASLSGVRSVVEGNATSLRAFFLGSGRHMPDSEWVMHFNNLSRPLRDVLISCMLERNLSSFKTETVESVLMSHSKCLLIDAVVNLDSPVKQVAPVVGVACKTLVKKLPAYLSDQGDATVNQAFNLLWAGLKVCPSESEGLLKFVYHQFQNIALLQELIALHVLVALARTSLPVPEYFQLQTRLVEHLSGRLTALTMDLVKNRLIPSCVRIPHCAAKVAMCRALDEYMLENTELLDASCLAKLCSMYRDCFYCSTIPMAALLEGHYKDMPSTALAYVLNYAATYQRDCVPLDLFLKVSEILLAVDARSILFTFKTLRLFKDEEFVHAAEHVFLRTAVAYVRSNLDTIPGHLSVQLLHCFVYHNVKDGSVLNSLCLRSGSTMDTLHVSALTSLLGSVAEFLASSTFLPVEDAQLAVQHPLLEGCHKIIRSLETIPTPHEIQQHHIFPLCLALRDVRLSQAAAPLLHGLMITAERGSLKSGPLAHIAYTLSVLGYLPAKNFLLRYADQFLRHFSREKIPDTEASLGLLVCQHCQYLPDFTSGKVPALLNQLARRVSTTDLEEELGRNIMPSLPPAAALWAKLPLLCTVITETFVDAMVRNKSTPSGYTVSVILFVDSLGRPVLRDLFPIVHNQVLSRPDSVCGDVFAVAVILLQSCDFALKATDTGHILLNRDHVVGGALVHIAELESLGYIPLPLSVDTFLFLADTSQTYAELAARLKTVLRRAVVNSPS